MRALTQVVGTGECAVIEVPAPESRAGSVLVRSRASLISPGTETMLLGFGRSNMLDKVRSQPERVKQVLEKAATDGVFPTLDAVRDKLADTLTPGYCQAGVVLDADGAGATVAVGDRVVTNGPHAEIVRVPHNLTARIPDGVDFETAAFTPLAAIALQGVRLAQLTLGEVVVVFGLGLVGQLAVQIVRANGCKCIGIDTDPVRVALAESFGATGLVAGEASVVESVRTLTDGIGADAVLMTLATDSDEPMHDAAVMSRKRGRIVLVGVTGLQLRRADFYEKELTFQVSCSYGPGRYDPRYEDAGVDYPLAFVRWTEQRNFTAVLSLMAEGRLDTRTLVSHRFPIGAAPDAYELLLGSEPSLGIILDYPEDDDETVTETTVRLRSSNDLRNGIAVAGVLGAGQFARRTLLPAARSAGFDVRSVVSSSGLSAALEGNRSGAEFASSRVVTVLDDPDIDTVFVLTRHDSHADLTSRALAAGKHVFVEKPLGLSLHQLEGVATAVEGSGRLLMVGFNRRFAPLAEQMKELLEARSGPLSIVITVNAGHVDRDHWTQDPRAGGGRIVGEACHFIDLARFLVGAPIVEMATTTARDNSGRAIDDISHLALSFADGSTSVVHYLSHGSSRFPKERVEVFHDGRTAAIDNWRCLRTWGFGRRDALLPRRMDKGHKAELERFAAAVRKGGAPPIPLNEIFEVSRWSIRAAEACRTPDESARQAVSW